MLLIELSGPARRITGATTPFVNWEPRRGPVGGGFVTGVPEASFELLSRDLDLRDDAGGLIEVRARRLRLTHVQR